MLFLSLAFFSPKVVFFSCFAVAGFQGTLNFSPLCTVPATEVLGRMCGVRVVYDLMCDVMYFMSWCGKVAFLLLALVLRY